MQYPGCVLNAEARKIRQLGNSGEWDWTLLLGAGEFLPDAEAEKYGFLKPDNQPTPIRAEEMNLGFGVQLNWQGDVLSHDQSN